MRTFARKWSLSMMAVLAAGTAMAQEPAKPLVVPQGDPADAYRVMYEDKTFVDANQLRRYLERRPNSDDLGASLSPLDPALRDQLGLVGDTGLVVVEVRDGGRAARAGLKVNDILLTLADKPLGKAEDLLLSLKSRETAHPKEPMELKLLRVGKPISLKVKGEVRVALAPASEPEEKPDYYIGTPVNPIDSTFRAHLEVPEGTGLIVGEIAEGSPAAKAEIKPGDILLSFDAQPLPDADSLRAKVQAKGPHPAELQVLRARKVLKLNLTPEPRKAELNASVNFVNQGLDLILSDRLENGVQVLQNVAPGGQVFVANPLQSQPDQARQYRFDFDVNGQPQRAVSNSTEPADLTKKIDELTAQVQALTKAVEAMRAAQSDKK